MKTLAELRQELLDATTQLKAIHEKAETESRELTEAEETAWAEGTAAAAALEKRIARYELMEGTERRLAKPIEKPPAPQPLGGKAPAVHTRSSDAWSLFNVVAASYEQNPSLASVERRASDEISELLGKRPRGYFVPLYGLLPQAQQRAHEQRNITKGTTGAGIVATDLVAEEFIEILRNESAVARAGARMLAGLVGDVNLPSQTGAAGVTWLTTEVVATTVDTTQDFSATVDLSPKTIAVKAEITRKMLLQSTPAVEDLVREDIRRVIGIGIDSAALVGTGTTQPLGVTDTTRSTGAVSVGTAPASTITWGDVVEIETDVGSANALQGSLAYMCNYSIAGGLKTTVISAESARFIAEVTNPMTSLANGLTVNGYPLHTTNQIPVTTATDEPALVFGNWNDVLIGMWGVLDVFSDPYTLGDAGGIVVRGFQDVDVQVRHDASFSIGRQSL